MKGLGLLIVGIFLPVTVFSEGAPKLEAFQNQVNQAISAAQGAADDLIALDYLKGKFQVPSVGQPTFYPAPYPLGPTQALPRLEVRKRLAAGALAKAPARVTLRRRQNASSSQSASSCSVGLNPPALFPLFQGFPAESPSLDCTGEGYQQTLQVDESGMASLQNNTSAGEAQIAYLSISNLSSLDEGSRNQLFSSSSGPTAVLKPIRATFLEYVFYSPGEERFASLSQAVKGIKVQVGNTLAILPVEPPPAPKCQISLVTSGSIREGSTVDFSVRVNSVTRSAELSAFGLSEDIILSQEILSRSTVGPLSEINRVSLTVPTLNELTPTSDGTHVMWPVELSVRGVDSSLAPETCEVEVRVEKTPGPLCTLRADNPQVSMNQSTRIVLDCNQEGSGPVTSATIQGTNISLSNKVGFINYQRTSLGIITVPARAVGPGGEYTGSVALMEFLGQAPGCPLDNPDHLWVMNGIGDLGLQASWPFRRNLLRLQWQVYPTLPNYKIWGTTRQINQNNEWGTCPANSYCMRYISEISGFRRWSYLQVGPRYSPQCQPERAILRNIGCFSKETRILMASGDEKPVNEMQSGDWVLNPHYQSPVRVKKVVRGPEKKSLYLLKVENKQLKVTEDHPFLTQRGWIQAKELKRTDRLFGKGKGKTVQDIQKLSYLGPQEVWNFELETTDPLGHVIVANGMPTGDLETQIRLKKTASHLLP